MNFSPGRIPTIFMSQLGAIALAKSNILYEGILGIKFHHPKLFLKHASLD